MNTLISYRVEIYDNKNRLRKVIHTVKEKSAFRQAFQYINKVSYRNDVDIKIKKIYDGIVTMNCLVYDYESLFRMVCE